MLQKLLKNPLQSQVEAMPLFEGIDLTGITWICGGDFDFIGPHRGAHVICLPGRDRTRYISEETMNLIL
jgi:hypothetical protein